MSEYRQEVLRMYRRGFSAYEIAQRLNKTATQIHQVLQYARRRGELVTSDSERRVRKEANQWRMRAKFRLGPKPAP